MNPEMIFDRTQIFLNNEICQLTKSLTDPKEIKLMRLPYVQHSYYTLLHETLSIRYLRLFSKSS